MFKYVVNLINTNLADSVWLKLFGIDLNSNKFGNIIREKYHLIINIFLALMKIVDTNLKSACEQSTNCHDYSAIVTLREITYIVLTITMTLTIEKFVNLNHQLTTSLASSSSAKQQYKVAKLNWTMFILFNLIIVSRIVEQTIKSLPSIRENPVKLIKLINFILDLHSICISEGLLLFSIILYASAVYTLHQHGLTFKVKVEKIFNEPQTNLDLIRLRLERTALQSTKQLLDSTINWWPVVWFIYVFTITCLCIVQFCSLRHNNSLPVELFGDSWLAYPVLMFSLISVTLFADYTVIFETKLTSYIGDNLSNSFTTPIEIKLEFIKISVDLRSRPFIAYTLGDMFDLSRSLLLSFFSAVLPISLIILSFVRN